ncbi:unnamed protein product [Staurois parvus]|uniref:Uncharacterized protein n=1 Tax=Staurois parvus TaxID=386267 RepID=A0ABN9DMC3_9NEOB|nr:unnamed protein product [Staurois parvus]
MKQRMCRLQRCGKHIKPTSEIYSLQWGQKRKKKGEKR